jgi:hypothetical protein
MVSELAPVGTVILNVVEEAPLGMRALEGTSPPGLLER